MVSVVHSLPDSGIDDATLQRLIAGLPDDGAAKLVAVIAEVRELYGDATLGTGESTFAHGIGAALILAGLNLDLDSRLGGLLFAAPDHLKDAREKMAERWGGAVAELVDGLYRLKHLRPLTLASAQNSQGVQAQAEILRKMLLALAADIRVVMMRLASRTQTLRWYTDHDTPERADMARESLQIYAPLANRLGVWQMKWEIEDLSFRFIEPATYKKIAKQLDEKRLEREAFITNAVARLKEDLAKSGVTKADVYGRPKHIYSIWNKMKQKDLAFSEVYDVRAMRIIVDEVKDCYTALGIVHALWQPIHGEFDDYISHPKGNYYRSLHTAVVDENGRSLEVQIRTQEMHAHAELGVAAHWRYKEAGNTPAKADSDYDDKIAWLRQLLSWRDEITDSAVWVEQFKRAALDDTIYVMTPQGRVIDMPKGATPIDFAYRVHTDLGHRCRGAKINGQLVPLNTPLQSGQQVDITVAKSGGPSRDWLTPGYLATGRARQKVKAWFADQQEAEMLANGRAWINKELQRDGATQANLEDLAHKLGFKNTDAMYLAAARNEIGPRAVLAAVQGEAPPAAEVTEIQTHTAKSNSSGNSGQILVVGMDRMLTQLGRCCKPVPPDVIAGFVTRGRGVSVHRVECANFRNMAARNPERVIEATWGGKLEKIYACDLHIEASDRQGLLRDISDVLSRERVNVTAVKTQSKAGVARMAFTVELGSAEQMQRILAVLGEVSGVLMVQRG